MNCKSNLKVNFNIKIIVLQGNDHNQGHPTTSVNQKPILKNIVVIERAHFTENYLIFYPKFVALLKFLGVSFMVKM